MKSRQIRASEALDVAQIITWALEDGAPNYWGPEFAAFLSEENKEKLLPYMKAYYRPTFAIHQEELSARMLLDESIPTEEVIEIKLYSDV